MYPLLIFSLILVYFGFLMLISWLTTKGGNQTNEDFFIGKKVSPWYVVAFGMIGASLSGVTFISVPGAVGNLAGTNGYFSYLQVALGYTLGYWIIATVLMPIYYRLNLVSIYTYLEQRLGVFSYKTGAAFFLLSRTIGASFRLYLVALVLQTFVFDAWGVPFFANILFTLLLIWLYTLRGGIKTIVWTDTLQTALMLLTVIFTIIFISNALGYSIGELPQKIWHSRYAKVFFFDNINEDRYFWKQFLSGVFIAIAMTGLDQDMMQKNNSCKNINEAQWNMFSFSGVLLLVNVLFVSLGALLYLYANAMHIDLPAGTDKTFPTLALNYFPPTMGIFFLLGLIAAAYSSADSALTALTTSFCIDFLDMDKNRLKKSVASLQNTRHYVHIGFALLIFLCILSFKYLLQEAVVSAVFRVASYTYGPLLGLFFFGIFTKYKVNDKFVPLVCLVSPAICYFLQANSEQLFNGYKFGFELLILNGLLTFVGLLLIAKKT
ncbi:MAG: sodium:solute symporter [Chitinophagales bacterium]